MKINTKLFGQPQKEYCAIDDPFCVVKDFTSESPHCCFTDRVIGDFSQIPRDLAWVWSKINVLAAVSEVIRRSAQPLCACRSLKQQVKLSCQM